MEVADWYAVQTKARQETVAQRHLNNQNFSTFLPRLRTIKYVNGQRLANCEPLFPGYLFVHLDIKRQDTSSIRSTRGVIRLVRQGREPWPVPIQVIDRLMSAQRGAETAIDPQTLFKPGNEVMLTEGPLAGLKAIFKAKTSRERVILMLDMLGRNTPVTVLPHHMAIVG